MKMSLMASFGFQDLGSKDKQVAKGNDGNTLCKEYWRSGIAEAGLHGEQALDFIIVGRFPSSNSASQYQAIFGDVSN